MTKPVKLLFAGLLACSSMVVNAQIKLGHINSTQLLSMMPETKVADSTLQKFGETLQNQMKTMSAEYDSKIADYQEKSASMADPIRKAKEKEIHDLGDRIQDFQESAQTSVQKKKEEVYSPIIKKAEDAIKSVAKEKGYTYVFDSGVGVLLYSNDSDDIMPLVKEKLKLK
ncbi:MAG: periplasmic chaperone [Bacteroidetes bacterium ADurb.Bin141]|nr:MAG: periplasmic chaperone [Bacteroidetes bacterium ADurb.Bin141]